MTKIEEQKILKRMDKLEKQVAELHSKLETNRLDKYTYTVKETADLLGVTCKTVYNMIEKGQLETVMLGHLKVLGSSLKEKLGAGVAIVPNNKAVDELSSLIVRLTNNKLSDREEAMVQVFIDSMKLIDSRV